MENTSGCDDHINILSALLFSSETPQSILSTHRGGLASLRELANSHHVTLRTFPQIGDMLRQNHHRGATFVSRAIEDEKSRISSALCALETICDTLLAAGCTVTVIK